MSAKQLNCVGAVVFAGGSACSRGYHDSDVRRCFFCESSDLGDDSGANAYWLDFNQLLVLIESILGFVRFL